MHYAIELIRSMEPSRQRQPFPDATPALPECQAPLHLLVPQLVRLAWLGMSMLEPGGGRAQHSGSTSGAKSWWGSRFFLILRK
jgi:hypothetical protein